MANRFTDKHKLVLTKALKKYGNPEGIQNIYELEGFLVGALCCPEITTMDDMMFAIFGPEQEAHPEWKNEAEVRDFFDSLFALQNKNNSLLRGALYRPKLLKDKKDHKKWCQGFMIGYCPEGAEEARQHSDNKSILTFLTVVAAISGIDVLEATPDSTQEDHDNLSVFLEVMTTKILASGVHELFVTFRLAESHHHCCDGDHHRHREEGMLH